MDANLFRVDKLSPMLLHAKDKVITQSMLNILHLCRRKFHLKINERLEKLEQAVYFRVGDAWHMMMAAHWKGIAERFGHDGYVIGVDVSTDPLKELQKWCDSQEKADYRDIEENAKLLLGMYSNYTDKFSADEDNARYVVVGIEMRMVQPIIDYNGVDTGWKFKGTADLVLYDRTLRTLIVVDHKTSAVKRENHMFHLDTMIQPLGYTWLVEKSIGRSIGGFMVNAARKKTQPELTLLKKKSTTRGISTPAGFISKAKVPDITAKQFRKELRKIDISQHPEIVSINDEYRDIIDALEMREDESGNSFVWRKSAAIRKERHELFLNILLDSVSILETETVWPMNLDACHLRERRCIFPSICVNGDGFLTRMGFKQREEGHFIPSMSGEEFEGESDE